MHVIGLDLWLWLAGLLEHVALLYVLVSRKRVRLLPVFTAWVASNIVRTVALFFVLRHSSAFGYYYAYLSFLALDIALQVAVAFEVALHVFRPAGRWSPGARGVFAWTMVLALTLSVVVSWLGLPATNYVSDTLVLRGNFLTTVLMSEVCVGILLLSVKLRLAWRTHVARVAQGLGAYFTLGIVIEALHTYFGLKSGTEVFRVISRVRVFAYQLTVLYWIVSLFRDAPNEQAIPAELRRQIAALQRWADSIKAALQSWGRA